MFWNRRYFQDMQEASVLKTNSSIKEFGFNEVIDYCKTMWEQSIENWIKWSLTTVLSYFILLPSTSRLFVTVLHVVGQQ